MKKEMSGACFWGVCKLTKNKKFPLFLGRKCTYRPCEHECHKTKK